MRNDLKDEPIEVPSLLIDDKGQLETDNYIAQHNMRDEKPSRFSNKAVACMLLLLFVVYSTGMVVLFWVFKQAADDVRYQLNEKTQSSSLITEKNDHLIKSITDQVKDQQTITKTSLESIRGQNKQLAEQFNKILASQQLISSKQDEQEKRLAKVEEQLLALSKSSDQTEQIKQLNADVVSIKKSQESLNNLSTDVQELKKQNPAQAIKSVQDDLLLLRSQLDTASAGSDNTQQLKSLQSKVEQQLFEMQGKIQNIQQQLDRQSPY